MEAVALIFVWTSTEYLSLNLDAWDFYSKLFTFIQVDGEPSVPSFWERERNSWRPELFPTNYLFTSKEMATSAGSGYDFCCGLPHNHTMCNSTSIKTLRVIKVRSNLG